eukprot:1880335-Prymnesium_polylepis.1
MDPSSGTMDPSPSLFLRVRIALTSTSGRRPDHLTRCHGQADITRDVTGHPTRCYTRTSIRVLVGPVLQALGWPISRATVFS